MKIFISWSGETSLKVARSLNECLEKIFENKIEIFFSNNAILPGKIWSTAILTNLKESEFGILCLTPENVNSPWVLFEAGALFSSFNTTNTCPYIFNLQHKDISLPLSLFQISKTTKEDTLRLIHSINNKLSPEARIPTTMINTSFNNNQWKALKKKLGNIKVTKQEHREVNDILEDILYLNKTLYDLIRPFGIIEYRDKKKKIIDLLIKNGADVNAQNNSGDTALVIAVKSKNINAVEQLLKAGADLFIKNNMGLTALDIAKQENDLYIANIIEKFIKRPKN